MQHPPITERVLDGDPLVGDQLRPMGGRSLVGSTPEFGPASAKSLPVSADECRLDPVRLTRQQQLAAETIGLMSKLNRKLESYLAYQAGSHLDESSKLLNDDAVVWMRQTLDDLGATVAGMEAAFPVQRVESFEP